MKNLFFLTLFLFSGFYFGQTEICNDGIDNDGDNLIDCADPSCSDCDDAFPCENESQLYQIIQGTLRKWNGASWSGLTPAVVAPSNTDINSIGYNVQDGYMYGINRLNGANNLYKISASGISQVTTMNPLELGNWHTGDFDLNGNLYVSGTNESKMHKIDVSTGVRTQIDLDGNLGVADWTFLPATGKLYGVKNSSNNNGSAVLRVVNLNGSFDSDIELSGYTCGLNGTNNVTELTGAMFADANGNLYASCNEGTLFKLTPNVNYTDFTVEEIFDTNSGIGSNDGASCPLSGGLDDDDDIVLEEEDDLEMVIDFPAVYEEECCDKVLRILEEMRKEKSESKTLFINSTKKEGSLSQNEIAILHQNKPNPFSEKTIINYEILVDNVEEALVFVFDLNGALKMSHKLEDNRKGELVISGGELTPGMYMYSLVLDSEIIDTKRMIITD